MLMRPLTAMDCLAAGRFDFSFGLATKSLGRGDSARDINSRSRCCCANHSRRSLNVALGLIPFGLCQAPCDSANAEAASTNPYKDRDRVELGPLKGGKIRACPNVNPNCVSTSSTNETYQSPWRTPVGTSLEEACELIQETMNHLYGDACTLDVYNSVNEGEPGLPLGKYMLFTTPGKFGQDKVEFIVRETPPADLRFEWQGEKAGLSVFYRSLAGGVKYIYPIQQPLSDFGEQLSRMKKVRSELEGWKLTGCELIECYE